MRKLLLAVLFALVAVPLSAQTVTLTGTFRSPSGAPLNGRVELELPVQAVYSSLVIVPSKVVIRITNGAIPSTLIYGNDVLSPSGTYYKATVYDVFGRPVSQANYFLTGSAVNLGTAIPTVITTQNISYSSVCLLNASCTISFLSVTRPASTTATFGRDTVSAAAQVTINYSSATDQALAFRNTNTGGKIWSIGDGIGCAAGMFCFYNQTDTLLAGSFTAVGQLSVPIITGTAPLIIVSTTKNANLTSHYVEFQGSPSLSGSCGANCTNRIIAGKSFTSDIGSIAANTCADVDTTPDFASGVSTMGISDIILGGHTGTTAIESGLVINFTKNGTTTVRMRVCNITLFSIDPANANFRYNVYSVN